MCGGYVVEEGTAEDIFLRPMHPYTQALIASMPKVDGEKFIQFLERNISDDSGMLCPFLSRCKYADADCEKCLPQFYQDGEKHFVRCHKKGKTTWEKL